VLLGTDSGDGFLRELAVLAARTLGAGLWRSNMELRGLSWNYAAG
jgi:hypothetical protein